MTHPDHEKTLRERLARLGDKWRNSCVEAPKPQANFYISCTLRACADELERELSVPWPPPPPYMPTMDEAYRFIKSNPVTTKEILDEVAPVSPPAAELRAARQAIGDEILKRIALRYKNCQVNIYPDLPELTPVEAVLRCAAEEGFQLTQRGEID